MENKKQSRSTRPISVTFSHTKGELTMRDLTHDEVDKFLKMLEGAGYVIGNVFGKRINFLSRYKDLPGPVDDYELSPYWRETEKNYISSSVQLRLPFMYDGRARSGTCGLYVYDLCGKWYSYAGYRKAVKFMEKCGFKCLRSRRDKKDGTFAELWCISDIYTVRGEMKRFLSVCDTTDELLKRVVKSLELEVNPKRIEIVK
jgi:hypothetical protein